MKWKNGNSFHRTSSPRFLRCRKKTLSHDASPRSFSIYNLRVAIFLFVIYFIIHLVYFFRYFCNNVGEARLARTCRRGLPRFKNSETPKIIIKGFQNLVELSKLARIR